MTGERCEVCTSRLDPTRPYSARRCIEHRDQVALFALDDHGGAPRPRRTTPGRASRSTRISKD